ncbi:unnamed protein product [Ixodes hexagonus]
MFRLLLAVLVAQLVLAAADHDHEHEPAAEEVTTPACSANEEYKACVSSTCAEGTCDKPQIGPQCTYDCHNGCYCSHGFFRNDQHICVTKEECPEGSPARTYVQTPHAHE